MSSEVKVTDVLTFDRVLSEREREQYRKLLERLTIAKDKLAEERAYSFSLQMKLDRTIYWCLASALIGAALAVIGIGWLYGNIEILFN